ncbi:putative membrane protein [Cocos nucifera]|uniref:Putative membrane protein n=1 Tax=Cocos nucifera TaxID=13894 RepID=A0A8K0IQW8_COCNU|nr:putative membrane protein [Cocos nucifera]
MRFVLSPPVWDLGVEKSASSESYQLSLMGSRFPSHQLSNGLYVSGRPEQPKEKPPTMSAVAMPYTGGDIKKSGELGKMFDIHVDNSKSRKSGPITNAPSRVGSFGGGAHLGSVMSNSGGRSNYSSGPVSSAGIPVTGSSNRQKSSSGPLNRHSDSVRKSSGPQSGGITPMARQNSGPLLAVLPATGLITSGPISSGPLNSSGAPRKVSGPLDSTGPAKLHSTSIAHNQAVTNLSQEVQYSFKSNFPKPVLWAVVLLFVMGFIAGGFILGAVHNAILLIVVVAFFGAVAALLIWNTCLGRRAMIGFIACHPDAELRAAKDGQYVKVSGVVTCGNIPLESSFQKVPRCVFTSTSLYEYRGWDSKAANPHHRHFTWGLRSMERHAVDFYISDFQSGLRALVKTGYVHWTWARRPPGSTSEKNQASNRKEEMPTLNLSTNVPVDAVVASDILKDCTKAVAKIIGKPESYVMISINGGVPMAFAGSEEPAAYGEVISIGGLGPSVNGKLSAALAEILETKLSVDSSRFYIKFYDVQELVALNHILWSIFCVFLWWGS